MRDVDKVVLNDRDKLLDYDEDEVLKIVNTIKDNARFNRFKVSKGSNRIDNENLIKEFNLTDDKIKRILLSIDVTDFCYGTHDDKDEGSILYVFAKEAALYEITDVKVIVRLYIKIKIVEGFQTLILVISLHKLKYDIDYLFK